MTKAQALYDFYNSFGMTAYASTSVPTDATMPYLTYEPYVSNWYGQQETYPALNIWMKTDSEKAINDKADEISKAIGSGLKLSCDDGFISVYFNGLWTPVADPDITIKRRYTTLEVVFYTN